MAQPPQEKPEEAPGSPDSLDMTVALGHSADVETALRRRDACEPDLTSLEWALVVYAGANLGRIFPLAPGENVIGRSTQVDIILLDEEVSRSHACIRMATANASQPESELTLEDLGSTNGTFLNGHAINGLTVLAPGDRLAIGNHVMKLIVMDSLERSFHETLLDQSTRDPLTGLGNRGATLTELQGRFDLSRRHGRPLSVIMCDLDHFKTINDTHGHGAGDAVLAAFGDRVRANLRGTDLAGRIGGEEFLLILPETDSEGAMLLAERLRVAVSETLVSLAPEDLHVTCSLGVAERGPEDRDGGALLGRADGALYLAKRDGRNRVVLAGKKH